MATPLVLLVDDTEETRYVYTLALEHRSLRVETASDGLEAIAKCQALVPDVVVLDLNLPGMDGLDVCRRLKDDPRTAAIPVIVLSGYEPSHMATRAEAAGAAAYLLKPCASEALHAEIARLIAV